MEREGGPPPGGSGESRAGRLGEPERPGVAAGEAQDDRPAPDLDARNERFARPRKPMGPPLADDAQEDAGPAAAGAVPDEPPVDPDEP